MNAPTNIKGKKLKLIKVGNSTGVILPKEVLDRLNLAAGDQMTITHTPEGISLSAKDEQFDEQMAAARKVMGKYRNALRELAK